MGRTNPTYRDAIRGLEREWAPMGRALRRTYRDDFDRLFDRAREFADAAGYANPPDPDRAFVLSLLLAHEVELRRLHGRIDALEAAVDLGEREAVAEASKGEATIETLAGETAIDRQAERDERSGSTVGRTGGDRDAP